MLNLLLPVTGPDKHFIKLSHYIEIVLRRRVQRRYGRSPFVFENSEQEEYPFTGQIRPHNTQIATQK